MHWAVISHGPLKDRRFVKLRERVIAPSSPGRSAAGPQVWGPSWPCPPWCRHLESLGLAGALSCWGPRRWEQSLHQAEPLLIWCVHCRCTCTVPNLLHSYMGQLYTCTSARVLNAAQMNILTNIKLWINLAFTNQSIRSFLVSYAHDSRSVAP